MPIINGRFDMGLFPKQYEIIEACRQETPGRAKYILVDGPRWASKTVACTNAVADHAFQTDRANIAVVTLTQSVGIDSGVWPDIVESIFPDWIAGDFGMEWVKKPYIQSVTKKPAAKIRNKFGTVSSIQLDSLKNEDEVEDRYKGKRYSMIFVNELSKFKKRKTFDTFTQCLRMMHLPEEKHVFLGDTNPADEGDQSWIWQLWFKEIGLAEEPPADGEPDLRPLRRRLKRIGFTIDDNLAVTAEKKAQLMADFGHDPDLLARYFYGQWVVASVDAIFHKTFRPLWHVIGDEQTASNPDPEIMLPEEGCIELLTGWDPGPINSAFVVGEKVFSRLEEYKGLPLFKILDENVVIGEKYDFQEYIDRCLEIMAYWEKVVGRRVRWQHWSDRSVFDMQDLQSRKYYHELIFEASGGKVVLDAAERSPGTLRAGVDLIARLLWENRIFMNRRCFHAAQMFKSIKHGNTDTQPIQKGSRYKHVLDAIRYMIQSEAYDELHKLIRLRVGNMRKEKANGQGTLVAV